MKESSHRYRQSRQGATVTSSKWFVPALVGSILAFGGVVVVAAVALQHAA